LFKTLASSVVLGLVLAPLWSSVITGENTYAKIGNGISNAVVGKTVQRKALVLHHGRVSPTTAIDPETKKEISMFRIGFSDIYRDIPNEGTSYVTWKENRVWSWDYDYHLKDYD